MTPMGPGTGPGTVAAPGGDVLALMLRHAHDRPSDLALRDDNESFTYEQLAARAAEVAAGLTALGVGPGDRVALHLGNSAAFVTTALGCLWVGAPFVPLAPDSPPARTTRVLEDCQPALVVGAGPDVVDLAGPHRRAVTVEQVAAPASGAPRPSSAPDRDVYIIYTSGTTGTPKGVTISERSFRWSVTTTAEVIGLDKSTRAMAVSAFHFDGSYGLVFPTLVGGGLLVVPKREDLLFLKRFYDIVVEQEITFTSFSPSYLRLLVSSRHLAKLAGSRLQALSLGGEACAAEDIAKLWAVAPWVRVFNRYGPTETTIAVTTYEIQAEDVSTSNIPLGAPHPGVEFFIVSEHGDLVTDAGREGELYIGGEQLMARYWGDTALSEKVMRNDVVPGRTVYKTGDLVYRNGRGLYVYRGRLDDVIKRNGVRISLTEIAGAFRQDPNVTGAFCALVDLGGTPGIAAFVEAAPGVTAAELREGVGQYLAANAMPDEVLVVSALPITGQGKVDSRRLLADADRSPWLERA